MISKIDIKSFGLYKNYTWDNVIGKGNEDEFRRVNIIYGRNYSGKTTLSRIFKCIEDKRLHSNFSDSNFTVKFSDNTFINNSNLESIHTIRVYNSDFVKDNLSWLHNNDGSIRPFTVLGAINI